MKLYDTARRAYRPFTPGPLVKIYVCGITPYDSAHLGHIFTFMTYDLLQRRLEDMGHEVQLVRNITDVDEPIYIRAKEMGIAYTELAANETTSFQKTMTTLNFRPPFAEPLASSYITEMSEAVSALLASKHAYYVDQDIYYDVSTYPGYTTFSGFDERLLNGLNTMRGGDPERQGKRQPLDFLVWKTISDPSDPAQWETALGTGRPGWHIECSVMSETLLSVPFDLHGGGSDLIFPHHSAEIAQSNGLGHAELARTWAHVSPLLSDGEKMSKSLGNLVFAQDLLAEHAPAVIRLALMHYHHRIGGEWQPELLHEAEKLYKQLETCLKRPDEQALARLLSETQAALDDDINTLEVIDALHHFVQSPLAVDEATLAATQHAVQQLRDLLGLD